jgi:hypothetical protein
VRVKADRRYLEKWREPRSLSKNNISLLSHQRVALVGSASMWVCICVRLVRAKADWNTWQSNQQFLDYLKLVLYKPYYCMGRLCWT